MDRATTSKDVSHKPAVPTDVYDPQVEILGDIQGKVKQVWLLDIDFYHGELFPNLRVHQHMDYYPLTLGELALQWNLA